LLDGGAEAGGGVDVAFEVEIFGDDTGVPRTAGSRDHAGDEVGKDSRQDQFFPALDSPQAKNGAAFLEIGGERHGPGDHVEQHIPLRAQQQHHNRGYAKAAAEADEQQQDDRQQRRCRDGSRKKPLMKKVKIWRKLLKI